MPYKSPGVKSQRQKERRVKSLVTLSKDITITKEKAIKLLKICSALDRRITGLQQPENMLDLVRYGSFTMKEIKGKLG